MSFEAFSYNGQTDDDDDDEERRPPTTRWPKHTAEARRDRRHASARGSARAQSQRDTHAHTRIIGQAELSRVTHSRDEPGPDAQRKQRPGNKDRIMIFQQEGRQAW